MSLAVDGVWKAGVWSQTVWADGLWFEGVIEPPVAAQQGGGAGHPSPHEIRAFLRYLKKKRKKELPEVVEEITLELAESAYAEEAEQIIRESVSEKISTKPYEVVRANIDYQALIDDAKAIRELIELYQLYLDDEEAIAILLAA